MELKGCLFDMDGVIVDSAIHHFEAWKRLADELSISFSEEDNHALKGLSRVDSLEHILRMGQLQLDEKTKVKLMDQKRVVSRTHQRDDVRRHSAWCWRADRGTGCRRREGGFGKFKSKRALILDNVGLTSLFDVVVDGNHLTLSKPDPEVF